MTICPLCDQDTVKQAGSGVLLDAFVRRYECEACGIFDLHGVFAKGIRDDRCQQSRYVLSGICREATERGQVLSIGPDNIDEVLAMAHVPKSPLESIDKLLLYIHKQSTSQEELIIIGPNLFPITYSKNRHEFMYIQEKAVDIGYVDMDSPYKLRLSLAGWQKVIELQSSQRVSNQAFVAMWFTDDLKSAYFDGFAPALEATGYSPIRVDLFEHNKKIDDEIIAKIRQSGLLVADFTGNRGGVYFEAGFAMGLGIPLIWCCRSDQIDDLHFDTRQYNHITWNSTGDLREKLQNRILATLPGNGNAV